MSIPCHIVVDGNPAIMYASRNGHPSKVLKTLNRFLDTFAQERLVAGESEFTPACLLAQVLVRFGFEFCEDDYSNLRVSPMYYSDVEYLYQITPEFQVQVWEPTAAYRAEPTQGLAACQAVNLDTLRSVL